MRQTLFVELNQKQQILALVKSVAELPWSVSEPGFHPKRIDEYVLLWNTYGQLACIDTSSCHCISSPPTLSHISLLSQADIFHSFADPLSELLQPDPIMVFSSAFFLFLYIFLKKLYNTVILTLCQCSSLLLSVQFIFSVVPPSPLLGLFSSY